MKRLAIALSIILLLAILSPCFSILAQPTRIPHQNPMTAKDTPDPVSLLLFYGNVFDLAAISQYQDAQDILNELEYVNIPDELRYLIDRLNTLNQQLFATMNNVEFLLDKASTLFSDNQLSEARQKLDAAEIAIHDALLLLDDIAVATNTLSDGLGVFTALASSQLKQAYEHLEGILHQLSQLIDKLNQLRESLTENPQMAITTSFYYSTLLEISAPETAYPGLPITISGQVSSTDGTVDRTIKVLLDNIQLAEEIIQGEFSLQIAPPPQISTGRHSLTVMAIPQGSYSAASKKLTINILNFPIQADIKVPRLIVTPELIQISGKVYHSLGPVEDARVSLTFGQSSTTIKTSTDGSFATTMEVPLDLSLVGPQELSVIIEPAEPWYASLQIKRGIFTINPANIGLMLIVSITLGILLYTRVRTRVPSPQEEIGIPEAIVREPPTIAPPPGPRYEFTGIKGRILSAYLNGLETVEKVTGVSMAPHTTLREFLKATTPLLPGAVKSFTELTIAAEIAQYSARKLDPSSATSAEQLALVIKEELYSEAA